MGDKVVGCILGAIVLCYVGSSVLAASQDNDSYEQGSELVAKRLYKEAVPYFDKAVQSDPKHAEAYLDRSLCNFHLGNYQKVIADCKEVLSNSVAPEVTKRQAYMMSAGAQNALGEYSDAVKSCDQAISMSPHASLCYSDRAFAYQQLKRYDEALRDCNEAIKLDGKHASNYELRASIYETLARQDRAKYNELLQARKPGEKPWDSAKKPEQK